MQTKPGGRILELDGLRGLAILLVAVFHYTSDAHPNPDQHLLLRWIGYGYSGVDLFFVLSGFLVGGILMDVRDTPNYFRTFYIRRTCRILPLYYFVLALYVCGRLDFLVTHRFPWLFDDALPLLSYATFTQNFAMASLARFGGNFIGVTWSVAVEEQFYITLPLLVRFLPRRVLPVFLMGSIFTVPLIRWYLASTQGHTIGAYALIFCRADSLYLGVMAAWVWRHDACRNYFASHRALLVLILALTAGYLIYLKQVLNQDALSMEMVTSGYSTLGLFFTALMLLVLTDSGALAACFRWKFLRFMGEISYGVYMIHKPISGLLNGLILHAQPDFSSWSGIGVQTLAFLTTLLVAYFSWHVFERLFVEFGHTYSYRISDAPAS